MGQRRTRLHSNGRVVDVAGGVLAIAHPDLGSRGSVHRYRSI
jgi:hypothetical protein